MTRQNVAIETFLSRLPRPMQGVHSERLELAQPFIDVVDRFADEHGTVALLGGGTQDSARYNILGIRPWLCVTESAGTVIAQF